MKWESIDRKAVKLKRLNFFFTGEFNWTVKSDSTDHFQFHCPSCGSIATVYEIYFKTTEGMPTVVFRLCCNKCKIIGQRKIYINEHWEGIRT
ncbi:MAG: hypothetical protein DRN12_05285 [Thermoplasmata archaeon]|mgnify:CR=1 FL=1|nr:MAG: hypothetical protein DRN12_05285 [Thermoplasmata archaeon]